MELENLQGGSGNQKCGFSFSMALREVRKNIAQEEKDLIEQKIRRGTASLN